MKEVKLEVKQEEYVHHAESAEEENDHKHKSPVKLEYKSEEEDSQDQEVEDVNKSAASSCDYNLSSFKTEPEESDDEDMPLVSYNTYFNLNTYLKM